MTFLQWIRTVLGLETWDRGFMVRDGKSLRWFKLPVDVVYAPNAEPIADHLYKWIREINDKVGRRVFLLPMPAIQTLVQQFQLGTPENQETLRKTLTGVILIHATKDYDPKHPGNTDIRYDKRTGEMRNCVVSLPLEWSPSMPIEEIVGHELAGHCTGLDHDGNPASIVHNKAQFGQQLLPADISRLKKAYP